MRRDCVNLLEMDKYDTDILEEIREDLRDEADHAEEAGEMEHAVWLDRLSQVVQDHISQWAKIENEEPEEQDEPEGDDDSDDVESESDVEGDDQEEGE